jgi:hypothetical protein
MKPLLFLLFCLSLFSSPAQAYEVTCTLSTSGHIVVGTCRDDTFTGYSQIDGIFAIGFCSLGGSASARMDNGEIVTGRCPSH